MAGQPTLQYDVAYPERLSRGLIFIKWLLVFPHFLVLGLLFPVLYLTTVLAWFAILFTGRYPEGLFNFAMMDLRWTARVNAYLWLQRDEYPPFGDGDYPVLFHLDRPARLSRWKIFVKIFLLIPHFIVLYPLGLAMYVVAGIAWLAILIIGRYPRGLFDFVTGVTRWSYRVNLYSLLLTDAYPPFTLAPVPSPTQFAPVPAT